MVLTRTRKFILGITLALFAALIFTVSVYARNNHSWRSRQTDAPSQTPTPSPTETPSPTPFQSLRPTPTKTASPTRSPRPTGTPSPIPTFTAGPTSTPSPIVSGNTINVYITFYGWNDNDPPGTAIAYPKSENQSSVHSGAGGVGTFDDPVTFAADPNVFSPGTKIYVPYIKKYALMEDSCASCTGKKQIDIWAGGNGQSENQLISCEETLTRDSEGVETNPSDGLEVDTTPIFDSATATCIN